MVFFGIGSQLLRGLGANDAQGQRIVKHSGFVKKLVSGAANGHAARGSAEFTLLHRHAPRT
jgi:hypothetical protein